MESTFAVSSDPHRSNNSSERCDALCDGQWVQAKGPKMVGVQDTFDMRFENV
jgi:hypothetical protein